MIIVIVQGWIWKFKKGECLLSKEKVYRYIIYFETDKVQSILAQPNNRLISSVLESISFGI